MSGTEPRWATFDRRNQQRLLVGLLALVLITLVASALWVSQRALGVFDEVLLPQFDQDAEIIAQRLGIEIERAALLGIPVDRLRGVDAFLDGYLDQHPALVYLALRDGAGRLVAAVGPSAAAVQDMVADGAPAGEPLISRFVGEARETSFRIGDPADPIATVLVGMDAGFDRGQIADMHWDILVVLVVSLLVAWEILVFLIHRTIVSPLRLIDQIVARALDGEWTVQPGARWRGDEIGAVLRAIDRLGRDIAETLMRIDRKLARLPVVPPAIGQRVEGLHRQIRLSVAGSADPAMETRVNARLPLFLFVFAEELSRSFLPLYAEQIYRPIGEVAILGPIATALGLSGALSAEIVIGLPIMVFMAGVALATPFGGSWVTRYGSRTIFLAGAVPAGIGYLGTALATTTYDMLLWRSLSAIGYALITIACQGYLARISSGGRASNMAVFVAAVTTAVICGSAIGAVLADRFGFRAVFAFSAGFVLLSAVLASRHMHLPPAAPTPAARVHLQFRALANPRFAALILLAAIPAKIALTGFLFYLVPLFLHAIDFSQPAIGRMIMLYGIFMLAGTRIGAQLHDRRGHAAGLIGLGGVLTGAALVAPHLVAGDLMIATAIGLFGLAQGIASAPMLAIIPQICPVEVQLYGVTSLTALLRLTERIGSVIGPLLAAVLIVGLGYAAAIAIIGVVSALSALTFLIVFFALSNRHIGTGEVR